MTKLKEQTKTKESKIGKIIYGTLLFLPLFAIGITCLVNVFKDNKPTIVNYEYETNEINQANDLKVGNIYHYEDTFNNNTLLKTIEMYAIYNFYTTNNENATYNYISNYVVNDSISIDNYFIKIQYATDFQGVIYDNNYTVITNLIPYVSTTNFTNLKTISFDFVYKYSANIPNIINNISKCENIPIKNIEVSENNNIFYTAIDQVENSTLFNWTQNSIIYTGIYETCNALSITNTFIPLLLTYWLIISVLYFLYDIVLMMLNILHKKIHELQDSF